MRVLRIDEKEGLLQLEPQSLEDLWYLSKILDAGDVAAGNSLRSYKTQDLSRPKAAEKKKVFVELRVEKVEFAEAVNKLRLTGVITAGAPEEFIALGEHHTLDVEIGAPLSIKKKLNLFHKKVLQEAARRTKAIRATIIALDEEKATVAELTPLGIKFSCEVRSEASKREPKHFEELKKKYFAELLKTIQEKSEKGRLVIAGPGFTKEEFKKYLKQKFPAIAENAWFETTSNAEQNGVFELVKKGIVQKLLGEEKISLEWAVLEEFKKRIARGGLACYGEEKVWGAAQAGAVEKILVLDELLRKSETARETVARAEELGAQTIIFESENAAGREFKAFGIAAFLRYKTE